MVVLMMTSRLFAAALLVVLCADTPLGLSGDQGPRIIRVSAERFAFTPSEIVVERGTVIEFHLTSDDTDHGFKIVGTDINAEIPKRRRGETVIKYTADTPGRFVIECSRPCGAGHTAMRATLVVK
jgi:cytochrome c oxidase subunit II